jgi:hypothetical protein
MILRATAAGLAVSVVGWFLLSYVIFLRYFLAILVGVTVGETMSRLARRRDNIFLESGAVIAVVAGLFLVETLRFPDFWTLVRVDQATSVGVAIPALVASFVAVVKLR